MIRRCVDNVGMPAAQPFVCFIRGINVGGNKILKMDALKAMCMSIGLDDVKTYLQSGNVVFRSARRPDVLTKQIENGIHEISGFDAKVILRTVAELREVADGTPFSEPPERDPKRLLVAFLSGEISAEGKAAVARMKIESEEVHYGAGVLYLYMPDGIAASKLAAGLTEKKLGVNVTARNWNTVTALVKLAEA